MRDENEKQILKAIEENDHKNLREILINPVGYKLGGKSILFVAIKNGNSEIIQFLIDAGCDVRQIDKNGDTALHHLLFRFCNECDQLLCHTPLTRCENKPHRLIILEILLAAYLDDVDAQFADVFLKANELKMTPFMLVCASRCGDAIVTRFLSLIENRSIPIAKLIGPTRRNAFHFLLNWSSCFMSPRRVETVRTVMAKIPFSDLLIDITNKAGETPIYSFFRSGGHNWGSQIFIELAKIFFSHGASSTADSIYRNGVFLSLAFLHESVPLVEVLLRAGCRVDIGNRGSDSSLSHVLKYRWRNSKSKLIRVIELLLAFGYDLQEELYLYTIDERPAEFASPKLTYRGDSRRMDPEIVEALREVRLSNELLILQRQCRTEIRRRLKKKADEVIRNLTCVPDPIKSYLLVENEKPLLQNCLLH